MKTLVAYNRILKAAGEMEVEAIDTLHPIHQEAVAALSNISTEFQTRGWWFNQWQQDVTTDVTGVPAIPLPASLLSLQATGYCGRATYFRGPKLYWRESRQPVVSSRLKADIIEQWEFEDLPEVFAEWVVRGACADIIKAFDPDQLKVQLAANDLQVAYTQVHNAHVRAVKVNMLETPSMQYKINRSLQFWRR